jgi:hypothetical protein
MTSKLKGQTSVILIVLLIVIFVVVGIFLLITSLKPEHEEYNNLYAHNLLLSVLRKNTGYGGYCDTYAATITCASTTDYRDCGGMTCKNLSAQIVPEIVNEIIKPTFDYCMIVEPENWTVIGGERILYGPNCPSVTLRAEKWTANERILQHDANLNIQMIITES